MAASLGSVQTASMGPGRKPRKELSGFLSDADAEGRLQWGLGENPGRNSPLTGTPPYRSGFNGAWAKTQEGTPAGRRRGAPRRRGFNGAWAKTQEGTVVLERESAPREGASMGPGRKPRKEPFGCRRVRSRRRASMGPGRKPRKEHPLAGLQCFQCFAASMGPGRKPRKEHREGGAAPRVGAASMGPGRKPRKERLQSNPATTCRPELQWGLGENPGRNRGRC